MQARYYKHSEFLHAKAGCNPSFIWRRILWGRQILQKGSRWRIGNGDRVQIFKDNCIPRPATFKPIFLSNLNKDARVAAMIDVGNNWEEGLIRQSFMKEDAEAIIKIPLPKENKEDEVLWHFDKKGQYSVKSGYQIALQIKYLDTPSYYGDAFKYWKDLWTLNIPEKIKIFLWRVARNLLPTAENLWRKKILSTPICRLCNKEVETITHSLLYCKNSHKIWRQAPFAVELHGGLNQDVLSSMQELYKKLTKS